MVQDAAVVKGASEVLESLGEYSQVASAPESQQCKKGEVQQGAEDDQGVDSVEKNWSQSPRLKDCGSGRVMVRSEAQTGWTIRSTVPRNYREGDG